MNADKNCYVSKWSRNSKWERESIFLICPQLTNVLLCNMKLQMILSHLLEKDQAHSYVADSLQRYGRQMTALIVWPLVNASLNKFKIFLLL